MSLPKAIANGFGTLRFSFIKIQRRWDINVVITLGSGSEKQLYLPSIYTTPYNLENCLINILVVRLY